MIPPGRQLPDNKETFRAGDQYLQILIMPETTATRYLMSDSFYYQKRVLVTGGASFIGSHLVDKLVDLGADVTVVDNLSSGTLENLVYSRSKVRFFKEDIEYVNQNELLRIFRDKEMVFHLAAVHGGRGYIQTHPADVCSNFAIDHRILETSSKSNVERVVFASSACVYPSELQNQVDSDYLLAETDSDPFKLNGRLSADIEYGWAKLMGEVQLISFVKQYGMKGSSVRFVTAYGPRENETHAIPALVYKAFERMDPYIIWGNGEQARDFTYVSDIVVGTLLSGEKITDGTSVNLGTSTRHRLIDVAEKIFSIMKWRPSRLSFDENRPVGVFSRALDIKLAQDRLGWRPEVGLDEGLKETIAWYVRNRQRTGFVDERRLMERS